jgi:hypothetical protein
VFRVSDASKDEALLESIGAVWQGLRELAHVKQSELDGLSDAQAESVQRSRVSRFLPVGDVCDTQERKTLNDARRRWLWIRAYRAALRSLTRLQAGLTGRQSQGRKSSVQSVSTPEDWGRFARGVDCPLALVDGRFSFDTTGDISALDRREYETLRRSEFPTRAERDEDRAEYRRARLIVWQSLQCAFPLPSGNAGYNARTAGRAARKRWRLVCLMLRGVPAPDAIKRTGLGDSFAINGKLSKLVSTWGLTAKQLMA